MKKVFFGRPVVTRACMFVLATVLVVTSCNKNSDHWLDSHKDPYQLKNFVQTNLVANSASYNPVTIDPLLINGWGLAFSPTGVAWPGSQGGHVGPVYNSEGIIARPAVTIPSPGGNTGGNPSGVVFNGSTGFALPEPNNQAARFIFVGLDGILSGWNAAAGNSAMLVKNNSATAVYTGLAIASIEGSGYLYASNFRAGTIDVFDKNFNPVWMPFKDPGIPEGYAPFNIQAIGNWLYVAYAKVGPDGRDVPGKGNGYVSIFTTGGNFVKRFASRGQLNAPWGIARTPSTFLMEARWKYVAGMLYW